MTKREYKKCEKIMDEAIRKVEFSNECWKAFEKYSKEGNQIEAEIKLRQSENSQGYAEGIRQVLIAIGFKHDRMQELFSRL